MDNQTDLNRYLPYVVISVCGKKKRIAKRFKKHVDALCYCDLLQNVAEKDFSYEVMYIPGNLLAE